jgi:uncharacterized membrane protein
MRTTADRIRHTLCFEVFGLLLSVPLASWAFNMPVRHMGPFGIGMAVWAMVWNYIFNLGFDHTLVRLGRRLDDRPAWLRVLHGTLFESGFIFIAIPAIMYLMHVGFIRAVMMEIGFALFYLVYAIVYNWVYDRVFPIPMEEEPIRA